MAVTRPLWAGIGLAGRIQPMDIPPHEKGREQRQGRAQRQGGGPGVYRRTKKFQRSVRITDAMIMVVSGK
jgi:hypothetical protein